MKPRNMVVVVAAVAGLVFSCKEEQKQSAKTPSVSATCNPNLPTSQYQNTTQQQYGTQQNPYGTTNNYTNTTGNSVFLQNTFTQQGQQVVYEGQVQQILQQFCVNCHGQNDVKNPMWNYQLAQQRGAAIIRTSTGFSPTMPQGATKLTEQNKQLLLAWQQGGFLERAGSTTTTGQWPTTTTPTTTNPYNTTNTYQQYGSANQVPCNTSYNGQQQYQQNTQYPQNNQYQQPTNQYQQNTWNP